MHTEVESFKMFSKLGGFRIRVLQDEDGIKSPVIFIGGGAVPYTVFMCCLAQRLFDTATKPFPKCRPQVVHVLSMTEITPGSTPNGGWNPEQTYVEMITDNVLKEMRSVEGSPKEILRDFIQKIEQEYEEALLEQPLRV